MDLLLPLLLAPADGSIHRIVVCVGPTTTTTKSIRDDPAEKPIQKKVAGTEHHGFVACQIFCQIKAERARREIDPEKGRSRNTITKNEDEEW